MKKCVVIVAIFVMGGAATFAYLYQEKEVSHLSAKTDVWTDNKPLISLTKGVLALDLYEKIAQRFIPTVVNIHTTSTIKQQSPLQQFRGFGGGENEFFRRFFDDYFGQAPSAPKEFKQKNLGSGFIISDDGYIITNHHVIDNADEIKVKLNGNDKKSFDAKLIGSDQFTDVALIKIDLKGKKLPVAPLGDSDTVKVGGWVLAIGHPFGYGHTVTHGIVSAQQRLLGDGISHPYNDYIQTDASINLGNSGGPLINSRGEVIGINVATDARAQGVIGFAIPINIAKALIPQLIKSGHAVRGFIGIVWNELTEDLAAYLKLKKDQKGVVISEIIKGNPADLAGLKVYDVIVEFNGQKIENGRDLLKQVGLAEVGKEVAINVYREGKTKALTLIPIERKEAGIVTKEDKSKKDDKKSDQSKLGLGVEDVNRYPGLKEKLNVSEGVIIVAVKPDSPAAKAGLEKGDVIVEANRQKIKNVGDFKKALKNIKKGKSYLFRIKNSPTSTSLVIVKVE